MRLRRFVSFVPTILLAAACGVQPPLPDPIHGEPGTPLPGLAEDELARFRAGAAVFARQFTPEEGLGPRFNENSCNACHTFPVDGGTGETNIRRISRTLADGVCDPMLDYSGTNLRLQVTPALAAAGGQPERDVSRGTHTTVFTIPFTFGMGLVDAVPMEALEDLADPEDTDGDGISGRMGSDLMGRPARFGRKGDVATLEDFVDGAFRMEMGLTTPLVPDEDQAGNPPWSAEGVDPAPEAEVTREDFQAVVDFMRFMAPLAPGVVDSPEEEAGALRFQELGCAKCHVPVLPTGPVGSVPAAAVALYSDLLLHDMGPGLEGTCMPGASNREYRTEPLMGLRYRTRFLHDGRATRVMDAILAHGGEAETAREAFAGLNRLQQEDLLRFLRTL